MNFNDYIENIISKYKGTDSVIAFNFEYVDDENISVKQFKAMEGIEATNALMLSKIDVNSDSLFKSRGCSDRDISKGKCYQITCHASNGTSTTQQCTGGAFGSCLSIGSACLSNGGCVEVCQVEPMVIFIPPALLSGYKLNKIS